MSEIVDPSFLTLVTEESKKVIKLMLSEKLQIPGKVRGEGEGKEEEKGKRDCGREPQHGISEFLG